MPKGVLWRQHDIFMAAMGGRKVGTWEIVDQLRGHHRAPGRELPAPADDPAAAHARRGAVGRLHADGPGGHARLPRRHPPRRPRRRVVHRRAREGQHHDDRGRRRAAAAAAAARQEELRPLVVLRRRQRRRAADAGRAGHGARAHAQPRHLRLGRLVGDRGADARDLRRRRRRWGRSCPGPGTVVVDETLAHVLAPGHEGNGWLAQTGNVPLGYLGDAGEDGAHLPRDRRRPLLHPRRPGAAPGRRRDRAARAATR